MSTATMKSRPAEGGVEAAAVGRGQHRVAGDGDERPDLALARRVDLLGQARRPAARRSVSGSPRTRLRRRPMLDAPADRGACPGCWTAPAAALVNMAPPGRSRLPVSALSTSTSQRRQRAELGGGGADAAVDARGGRAARSRASRRIVGRLDAGDRGDGLGRERRRSADDLVEAGDEASASAPRSTRPSAGQRAAPWPSAGRASVPGRMATYSSASSAVRVRRGSTTTSVPPRARSASSRPGPVGRGGQAAVGRERVGAEHEQVVGAVDVGHRHGEAAAEHEAGGDLLGPLVDGAGREDVAWCRGPGAAARP